MQPIQPVNRARYSTDATSVSTSAGSGVDTARVVDHVEEGEQFLVTWRVGAVRW
jgi:hypothetical protein